MALADSDQVDESDAARGSDPIVDAIDSGKSSNRPKTPMMTI